VNHRIGEDRDFPNAAIAAILREISGRHAMNGSGNSVIQGFFAQGVAQLAARFGPRAAQARCTSPVVAPRPSPLAVKPTRPIQPHASGNSSAVPLPDHLASFTQVGGQPLPAAVRQKMESFFGASFGDVRVHVGPHASAIGALAFTQGTHIHFAPGQYNPSSPQGQQLLGHELTHVVQQRAGRVRNPFGSGVAVVQNVALEAEAERLGRRASAEAPPVQPAPPVRQATQPRSGPLGAPPPKSAPVRIPPPAIQRAKKVEEPYGAPPKKTGSVGKFSYYVKEETSFATDGSTHWYWRKDRQGWNKTKTGKGPTYNRFKMGRSGRGGFRAGSLKGVKGSGANYRESKAFRRRENKRNEGLIVSPNREERKYIQAMKAATETELGVGLGTARATEYAARWVGGPPVITGGYNWCHLIGHGGGGGDDPANLVAASTHNNSEQLAIERIVYQYKNSGVGLRVEAELYGISLHLARHLVYVVMVNGKEVYERRMDAWRPDKPTFKELSTIKSGVTDGITSALK
jgi:hypothetical protein